MIHFDGLVRGDERGFFATCCGHIISEADARSLFDEHIDVIKRARRSSRRLAGTANAETHTLQTHFGPTVTPQAGSCVDLWVFELDGRLPTQVGIDTLTEEERPRVTSRPFFFWRTGSIVLQDALGEVIRRNAAAIDAAIAGVAPRHHRDMMEASAPFEIALPRACTTQVLAAIPLSQRSAVVEREGIKYVTISLRLHPDHSLCNGTINHAELCGTRARRHHPSAVPLSIPNSPLLRRTMANCSRSCMSTASIFAPSRLMVAAPFWRAAFPRPSPTTSPPKVTSRARSFLQTSTAR